MHNLCCRDDVHTDSHFELDGVAVSRMRRHVAVIEQAVLLVHSPDHREVRGLALLLPLKYLWVRHGRRYIRK